MHEDLANRALSVASKLGVSFAELRLEDTARELIVYVNGRVVSQSYQRLKGAGVRVLVNGNFGFASTHNLSVEGLTSAVEEAVKAARAIGEGGKKISGEVKSGSYLISSALKHPSKVSVEEKLDLVKRTHDTARSGGAASVTVRFGAYYGSIELYTSEGVKVTSERLVTGLSASAVLRDGGSIGDGFETYGTSRGVEAYKGENAPEAIAERALSMARDSLKAKRPPAGELTVITRPDLTGVFAHESFGHLTEGEGIYTGVSPLAGRFGEKIASDAVTIVDAGIDERGGIFFPVDDEGIPTTRVTLVEKGLLKGYLHSRETAALLGMEPTGNGRAQDFYHEPIVRMRNTFFEAGDWSEEEIIRDTKFGLLLDKPRGGQVEEDGTFTFNASIGYLIENGEIKEPVKDVVLAGNILEMLKHVNAVSKTVSISTSPFGGCGKMGQMVHVGDGGPTLRTKLLVGGETK
ncbi:MAG: TldD/PmbA family protein [Thermofilaceae archaeon]